MELHAESPRFVGYYVFLTFVNLGGGMVQSRKFINWGGVLTEGGGYHCRNFTCHFTPSLAVNTVPEHMFALTVHNQCSPSNAP